MDWTPIAEMLRANPTLASVGAGVVVAHAVQVWKQWRAIPPGEAKWSKIAAAVVAACLVAWAEQVLAGGVEPGQLAQVALVAWATGAGYHATALRGRRTLAKRTGKPPSGKLP